jgi:3-oxoacyl-[acyl-carrier-protein] synthase-3
MRSSPPRPSGRWATTSGQVDCLVTGTSLPDQLMPNHAVMVHGELGWPRLEVVACAGICLAGTTALKHAWLSVRAGDARRAVATGSELASAVMRGSNFEAELEHKLEALEARPELAFEKDFLRWMLSDGAGAVLLEREPRGPLSLRVEWIDLSSAAHELPVCMYAGADKNAEGGLDGWARTSPADWQRDSTFAVKQDVRLLNENIVRATLGEPLAAVIEKRGLKSKDIDWFLPHLSSNYFVEPVSRCLEAMGFAIPRERWFSNLAQKGNTGSASPYIMLDELFRSGPHPTRPQAPDVRARKRPLLQRLHLHGGRVARRRFAYRCPPAGRPGRRPDMDLDAVPQEGNATLDGHAKLMYARDAQGRVVTTTSRGWEAEEIVTSHAVDVLVEQAQAAKERVKAGLASPLEYWMYERRMDVALLSQTSGFWQWRVRRHLLPRHFAALSQAQLLRYADALGLPIPTLQGLP